MADQMPVVMDNGTGYSKLGFAGNPLPSFVFPTAIATRGPAGAAGGLGSGRPAVPNKPSSFAGGASRSNVASKRGTEDLDFFIGDAAIAAASGPGYGLSYPIIDGQIENWDQMERFWSHSIFKYLRVEPENHLFLLTEPPLNSPQNREKTAEIMFETFGCGGLSIAIQAVLALAAPYTPDLKLPPEQRVRPDLSGTVIDSGEGVTQVIPVNHSYVDGASIKSIPIAGRHITSFVQSLLRDRGEPETSLKTAERIKEDYGYVPIREYKSADASANVEDKLTEGAQFATEYIPLKEKMRQRRGAASGGDPFDDGVVKEFAKFDREPGRHFKKHTVQLPAGRSVDVDVGHEQFLAPEILFTPTLYSSAELNPLPHIVDSAIQFTAIDSRKRLYENIVLSGGSTTFKGFGQRLVDDIQDLADERIQKSVGRSGGSQSSGLGNLLGIKCKVTGYENQRHGPWCGGSYLASLPEFKRQCITKAQYDEGDGPRLFSGFTLLGQQP